MKQKKTLVALLALLMASVSAIGFTACDISGLTSEDLSGIEEVLKENGLSLEEVQAKLDELGYVESMDEFLMRVKEEGTLEEKEIEEWKQGHRKGRGPNKGDKDHGKPDKDDKEDHDKNDDEKGIWVEKIYIDDGQAAQGRKLVVYRLWNQGGAEERNAEILSAMESFFPKPWKVERKGTRIADRVYLEYGDKFDWPDLSAEDSGENVFCYGLRDQIGVLCDGTVVPCCLDHDGDIPLGNLFFESLEEILEKPRTKTMFEAFSHKKAAETLCRRCGYARRFG